MLAINNLSFNNQSMIFLKNIHENYIDNFYFPIIVSSVSMLVSLCIIIYNINDLFLLASDMDYTKEEKEEDEDDEIYEDNSNENPPQTKKESLILFQTFNMLTKKQLVKMTSPIWKNKNKDELIVIAIHKFIIHAIDNAKYIPKNSKYFLLTNRELLKKELIEFYGNNNLLEAICDQEKDEEKDEDTSDDNPNKKFD